MMTERFPDVSLAARAASRPSAASALRRIAALTGDWNGIVESSAGVGVDDEHDPEGATARVSNGLRSRALLSRAPRASRGAGSGSREAFRRAPTAPASVVGDPIAPDRLAARPHREKPASRAPAGRPEGPPDGMPGKSRTAWAARLRGPGPRSAVFVSTSGSSGSRWRGARCERPSQVGRSGREVLDIARRPFDPCGAAFGLPPC